MNGYPGWFPRLVIGTIALVSITGWLLVPTMLDLRMDYDVNWRLDSADRILVVSAHVLTAFVLSIGVGRIWHLHIPVGLKRSRNVYSGVSVVAAFLLLIITGVGVLYIGDRALSIASSAAHTVFGAVVSVAFVVHFIRGRQLRVRDK
jgi:hypothetical protein